MKITVGLSEMKFSQSLEDEIITHALGSCIGLVIYDKINIVGGMLHFMLPKPNRRPIENPLMYGETAIPIFINEFTKLGGSLKNAKLKAGGGALINDDNKHFNIGVKNILSLNKMIWQNSLMLENADLGGKTYRTMRLIMKNGKVFLKNYKKGIWEL